jgi:ankyrin repeat protein
MLVPMYLLAPDAAPSSSAAVGSVWDERDCDRQKAKLAAGADPNEPNSDGLTPLMNAARLAEPACVRPLIAAGADLESMNDDGDTALTQAIVAGRDDNADLLRSAGARDFRVTAATGRPITEESAAYTVVRDYVEAVHRGDLETMTRLVAGASLQRLEERREDLLMWQSLRPKTFQLVDGWANDQAATLTVRGTAPSREVRVVYHLESSRAEAGPGTWRIRREWFPDDR